MSTLDELKKQASEATQRNQVKQPAADDATAEKQWRKLAPIMKYLLDHYTELAGSLNVLNKGIPVDFKVNDAVTLKGLKGKNYQVTHSSADKEKEFVFEFENTGEHAGYTTALLGSPTAALKDLLNKNQIKFVTSSPDTKSTRFEIKPSVKTKYQFAADVGKECINLTITNYNQLWSKTNALKKNDITTALMDELTKHVLRQPNKYDEMMGNVISEAERTRIREKLKSTTQPNATAVTPAPPAPAKEKTLLGKLFGKK